GFRRFIGSSAPILFRLTLHRWRIRIFDLYPMRRTAKLHVRFGSKADMDEFADDVCYSPESGHSLKCRLSAKEKSNHFRLPRNVGDYSERYIPDYLITSTGAGFERSAIKDRDPAAAVTKNAALLQFLGEQRHRRAPEPEHFREKLLRQQQLLAANPVGALQ